MSTCMNKSIIQWFHNKSCLLWWPVLLSIRIQTTLNHIRFVLYHNIKDNKRNLCYDLLTNTNTATPTWKCTRCIMQMSYLYASAFLSKISVQTRSTCRSNEKTLFRKRVQTLMIRVQTTKPHFDLFLPLWTSKKMFFSSVHEFKKALRDTLMRAAWCELLSTMANCGKIVTFLCLGIYIITWVLILKQLFASGSWILVNMLPFFCNLLKQIKLYVCMYVFPSTSSRGIFTNIHFAFGE